jgi:hypothetical protein
VIEHYQEPGQSSVDRCQLRILRLGLFQDRDVRIGVFPKGEEAFVSVERPKAGGIGIRVRAFRLQGIGTSQAQTSQSSRPAIPYHTAVVEDFLKLGCRQRGVDTYPC